MSKNLKISFITGIFIMGTLYLGTILNTSVGIISTMFGTIILKFLDKKL